MIAQFFIAVTGVIAIWLTQSEDIDKRKYACLFGMAGQPFWFWSAYSANQWGIFLLSVFYALAWYKGIKLHWLNRG